MIQKSFEAEMTSSKGGPFVAAFVCALQLDVSANWVGYVMKLGSRL